MYDDPLSPLMLAVRLLAFTGIDGQVLELNPIEIISIREPRSIEHFGSGTRCLIFTTDGKFIPVQQTCKEVHQKVDGDRP
jgi:hypothetical protein